MSLHAPACTHSGEFRGDFWGHRHFRPRPLLQGKRGHATFSEGKRGHATFSASSGCTSLRSAVCRSPNAVFLCGLRDLCDLCVETPRKFRRQAFPATTISKEKGDMLLFQRSLGAPLFGPPSALSDPGAPGESNGSSFTLFPSFSAFSAFSALKPPGNFGDRHFRPSAFRPLFPGSPCSMLEPFGPGSGFRVLSPAPRLPLRRPRSGFRPSTLLRAARA